MRFNMMMAGLALAGLGLADPANAMVVTPTTDGAALLGALLPASAGFGAVTATDTAGAAEQVGTFTGFTSGPVQLPMGGIVLSTGKAADTTAASHSNASSPSSVELGNSTPEINAYAPGKITNFNAAYDAARITVSFSLTDASAIAFDFVFGSTEYPVYSSSFTDAAYVFLDGTQITFDSNGVPVQVGASFGSQLTTADTNTAFSEPHGVIGPLTTTSATLAAGSHTLQFEVADTNDQALDSALFVSDLRLAANAGGPTTGDGGVNPGTGSTSVPEPAALAVLGFGLLTLLAVRRRAPRAEHRIGNQYWA